MPFRLRYLHLHAIAIGLLLSVGHGEARHTFLIFVNGEHEVEWRNIVRHSDVAIVGKDGRQALDLFGIRGHIGMVSTR